MPITTATMSYTEAAAWLYNHGLYATLEAAYQAAPHWLGTKLAGESWSVYSSYGLAKVGGAASAASSATETAIEVAKTTTLTATKEHVTTMGVGLSKNAAGYSFSTLMAADVGLIGAAAAPILGVKLGEAMYESNPELWTKLSQKLLPFCYPGTTQIPTWADIVGEVWIVKTSKDVIDAIKELFDEEKIGPDYGDIDISGTGASGALSPYSAPVGASVCGHYPTLGNYYIRVWGGAVAATWAVEAGYNVYASSVPGCSVGLGFNPSGLQPQLYLSSAWTLNGQTVYWTSTTTTDEGRYNYGYSTVTGLSPAQIAWYSVYGTPVGGFPSGTSRWTGVEYPTIPTADPIIIDDIGTTIDTVPLSLPTNVPDNWKRGYPAPSNDPEIYPDPATTYLPDVQVDPYIAPWNLPDIITSPESFPLPETDDPSLPVPPATKIIDLFDPPVPSGQSPVPLMPTTELPFSQNRGLITVYHPTSTQLYSFEEWLWVTYADATIDKIFNNPFDGVITLFELYCTPTDVGTRNIHSGFLDSGINSAVISRYTEINCGTLGIPEYYGDYFDYSPYSKAHIYLPFIGIQELNVDDIVGHAVNVTYRIDEYNGSCIAMITVAKSTTVGDDDIDYSNVMYQFSGNCSVELPLAGGTQAAIKAGMMQANAYQTAANISAGASLIGGVGSLLLGSVGGAISGVGNAVSTYQYGQANALSNMLSGKSTVQKSGQFGASHGALGIKKPFIVVTRPKEIAVSNYQELYGYPSHKMVTVGACTGYLRCREVHVISATATDDEKSMIEQLLKSGVYVTEE